MRTSLAGRGMIDKFDFLIPFKDQHVQALSGEACGFVDIKRLGFDSLPAQVCRLPSGEYAIESISTKWESIETSNTNLAMRVYAGGDYWPHVRVKASPAKLLQCHNVFGPDDPALCGAELLTWLCVCMPALAEQLDFRLTEIMIVDCTYSVPISIPSMMLSVINAIGKISNKQLFCNKNDLDSTKYFNRGSEHGQLKVYLKLLEMLAQIRDLKKKNRDGRYNAQIVTLEDPQLEAYAANLMRFESTLTKRKLKDMGIPTLFIDFCRYDRELKIQGRNLIQELFMAKAAPLFEALEGRQVNVYNDDDVREKLRQRHGKLDRKGNLNFDAAMAAFRTYRGIAADGYKETMEAMSRANFYRHVKMLTEAGLSKAQLQNLHDHKETGNVVPLLRIIDLDFSKQHPDWYVPPQSQFQGNHIVIDDFRQGRASLRLVS